MSEDTRSEQTEPKPAETGKEPETPTLSKEQEEILLKRLRDLGYVE